MGSPEETHLLAGAHFRARACISPESPKLETTRSLPIFRLPCLIKSRFLSQLNDDKIVEDRMFIAYAYFGGDSNLGWYH